MSANTSGTIATYGAIFGLAPLKRSAGRPRPRSVAAAVVRIRQLLQAIKKRRDKPPHHGGGPKEPPPAPTYEAHWDDPALWMLMWH